MSTSLYHPNKTIHIKPSKRSFLNQIQVLCTDVVKGCHLEIKIVAHLRVVEVTFACLVMFILVEQFVS